MGVPHISPSRDLRNAAVVAEFCNSLWGPLGIADSLQEWTEEMDVAGIPLTCAVAHETFKDAVTHLMHKLQKRGICLLAYKSGSLREMVLGEGPHPPNDRPGRH